MNITATASRDGRFWLVYVPEVDRYTQGRNLVEAREMARDLAATLLDLPIEDVVLTEMSIELPAEVQADLDRAQELRKQASDANHEAAQLARAAASRLRDGGLTVRDVGAALGVSYQRAHQLIEA